MIGLRTAQVALDGRAVLHDIDFHAGAGELVALCGPNGAGKTTLLRALAGLLAGGRPRPRRVAYVEQGARCAWGLRVAEVVALGRVPHGDGNAPAIDRAIAACGLEALRDRRIDRLSGGQARRAMLARAMATEPEVLLLDEPAADLDPAAAHEIMAMLARFAAEGRCVVVVLHGIDLARRYASRMVVLDRGRIVADAAPAQAMTRLAGAFGMKLGTVSSQTLMPLL